MTANVDICNFALMHLGVGQTISSLSEDSAEAKSCARIFSLARQSVLRDHNWNFATKQRTLSLVTQTDLDSDSLSYHYPNDCLSAIAVKQHGSLNNDGVQHPFRIIRNSQTDSRNIMCNVSPAVLEYIADVDNPTNFDPLFIETLAFKIAALLAFTLTGKRSLSGNIMEMYQQSLSNARLADAKENKPQDLKDPEWLQVR